MSTHVQYIEAFRRRYSRQVLSEGYYYDTEHALTFRTNSQRKTSRSGAQLRRLVPASPCADRTSSFYFTSRIMVELTMFCVVVPLRNKMSAYTVYCPVASPFMVIVAHLPSAGAAPATVIGSPPPVGTAVSETVFCRPPAANLISA
jgi:hypothetical protein